MVRKRQTQQSTNKITSKYSKPKLATGTTFTKFRYFLISRRRFLTVIIIIIGLAILVPFLIGLSQRIEAQARIENYLETKYSSDFVVGLPIQKANGYGVEGYFESKAFPSDQRNLEFIARTSSVGTSDDYPASIWREQEKAPLETRLRVAYSTVPSYSLEIYSIGVFNERIKGVNIPTIDEVAVTYPGELPYRLTIYSKGNLDTELQRKEMVEKLYEIIEYVRSKKVDAIVTYCSEAENNQCTGVSLDSKKINKVTHSYDLLSEIKSWRRAF